VRFERSIVEEPLMKVNLPFSLKLGPITSNTTGKTVFSGGLIGNLIESNFFSSGKTIVVFSTSYLPYLFTVCKDVKINDLQTLLNKPWIEFKKTFETDAKLWGNTIWQSQEEIHSQKSILLTCPTSDRLRMSYALVAYQLKTDEQCDNHEPIAVISVIHLPDDFCNSPAVMLSQFLKFKDNRMLNLKVSHSLSFQMT